MSHHSFHFNCHLFHFLLCVKYITWWPLLILTKSCKVAASHFTDEETFQMRKLDSERPCGLSRVNKWQNQDSNLSLYDPKAHSLFTLLPCLQIKAQIQSLESCVLPSKSAKWQKLCRERWCPGSRTSGWNEWKSETISEAAEGLEQGTKHFRERWAWGLSSLTQMRRKVAEGQPELRLPTADSNLKTLHAQVQRGLDSNGHSQHRSSLPSAHAFHLPWTYHPCWLLPAKSSNLCQLIWPSSLAQTESPRPLITPENWSVSICKQYFPPSTSRYIGSRGLFDFWDISLEENEI